MSIKSGEFCYCAERVPVTLQVSARATADFITIIFILLQYRIVEEFRADALLIVHNTVIYHGGHSNMADLARQMFRDCTYDLKEISQCRDCYRFANENPTKYWFCKPCRPFHELVSIHY